MKYIERQIEPRVLAALKVKEYVAIIGPRQAGKTTLLGKIERYLLEQMQIASERVKRVSFQNPLELASFESDPLRYIQERVVVGQMSYLLIDEFQYAKNAGRDLKLIYDTQPNLKIIITGSSSLELRQIASQMVGRMFRYYLGQFSRSEWLGSQRGGKAKVYQETKRQLEGFLIQELIPEWKMNSQALERQLQQSWEESVLYGSYPAIMTSQSQDEKEERLLNLYNSYVEKDILGLLQLGKAEKFLKLVQYLSLQIGQLWNQSRVQTELGLSGGEVESFLSALQETYIIRKVLPYATNKTNELRKTPLYYFLDTGLRNWALANFQDLSLRTDRGHLVENVVLKQLLDLIAGIPEIRKVYYWRKKSGAEVDLVLERLGERPSLIPIEVKYQVMNKPEITKSFMSFVSEYQPKIGMVVTKDYWGRRKVGKTEVLFLPAYGL